MPRSEKRSGVLLLAWVLLVALPAHAAERALTLDEALRLALERNPDVRAVEAEVGAARARQAGASLLLRNNPELEAALGPRRDGGDSTMQYGVSLTQPVEVGGQRAARREEAQALHIAAEARLVAQRVSLVAQVREAFGRALAAGAQVELAAEAVELAGQALQAAEERYREGDASRIEVNTARVEAGRARRERLVAEGRRKVALGALMLLVGLEADESVAVQGTLEPASTGPLPELSQWMTRARDGRRELVVAREELRAAEAGERLAAREAIPSPRLGVAYNREEDAHIVQGTLGLTLPLFQRNQAERGAARARAIQARAALEGMERRVAQEVQLAMERRRVADEALRSFTGEVLEAARENAELATEGYRAGQLDFLQLVLLRREALEARRGHIEALEELNAASAELERVVGAGLPALANEEARH
ncbi:TolC family protein [Pyxidicoccus fallax]|uniref:TolC family protein n=1 Tax=Pyxidicoccus fallax TaxID=394095 RepID=A0A848L6M9_9BACT|nr:TolC family protein [Pyxidicoccus fallax]NMO14620.1 TolC family protein [Pyxidicoccus fallax]NPC77384.1 TolC family protein [Pyxidicoccus fallax]